LRLFLQEHGVGCEIYYPLCLHQQECLQTMGGQQLSFPISEQAAASSLALPIYPELSSEQLAFVVETIKHFYHGA
jgi:dTDP-4-amino-4,6-dideoxygalactose transaminase